VIARNAAASDNLTDCHYSFLSTRCSYLKKLAFDGSVFK